MFRMTIKKEKIMTGKEAQLDRFLYDDEREALQRRWTPRQDGRREGIVHKGRPLLVDGIPQVATDVVVRLLDGNSAVIFSTGQGEDYRYKLFTEKNRLIAQLLKVELLFQMVLDSRRDSLLSDDWKEKMSEASTVKQGVFTSRIGSALSFMSRKQ